MHLHRNHVSDYKHPGIKFHGQSVFSIGGCSSTRESKTLTKAKFKVKSDHRLQLIRYCIAKVILPYPFLLQEKQRNRFFSIFYLAINAGSLLSTILPCVVECTSQLVHPVYKASPDWIAICRTGGLVASLCKFNTWPQGKDWGCFVAETRDSTIFFFKHPYWSKLLYNGVLVSTV